MSNFQKKYYYDFKSLNDKTHTVEIWQDISTNISSTKVIGALDPFVVTLPALSDKFQPVRGTGADLNLFATSTMQYMDLYTADIQEYQVRHYIDNSINWCGYLDTEMFSSDFSRQKNYGVSIIANDGFALLERLNYVQSDGSKYTGLTTQWQVIQNIINKLDLPYNNVYVSLSTTITGITLSASETIFHKTYCNNQNWYNEDGDAETCRKVLESILQPYGCFIIQDRCSLYVVDINTLAKATSTTFKKYTRLFSYVGTQSINLNLGDLSTIGFASNIQDINIVPGFNKQVIKYSPYVAVDVLDYPTDDDVFFGVETSVDYGESTYTWTEKSYGESNYWGKYYPWTASAAFSRFCELEGTGDNEGTTDKYLALKNVSSEYNYFNAFTWTYSIPSLVPDPSAQHYLKIEMKSYARTTDNMGEISGIEPLYCYIDTKLKVGDYYYNYQPVYSSDTGGWTLDSSAIFRCDFKDPVLSGEYIVESYNSIGDKWVDLKNHNYKKEPGAFYIPLDPLAAGDLTFIISNYICYGGFPVAPMTVKDVRIKDIKFTVVDKNYNDVSDKDTEYVGYMNKNYKNEGSDITLLQGTNKPKIPSAKGSLMGYNTQYYYLSNWTREANTDCIENLLLRSIVGNYTDKTIELSATTKQLDSGLGCLKYNDYLTDKVFMPTSITNDYANSKTGITMQEIFVDALTINKSF
jgi:hypothetical protein